MSVSPEQNNSIAEARGVYSKWAPLRNQSGITCARYDLLFALEPCESISGHIEMCGYEVSAIVRYDAHGHTNVKLIFPAYMKDSKDIRGHLKTEVIQTDIRKNVMLDGKDLKLDKLKLVRITFDGVLWMYYHSIVGSRTIKATRSLYPSTDNPCFLDTWRITVTPAREIEGADCIAKDNQNAELEVQETIHSLATIEDDRTGRRVVVQTRTGLMNDRPCIPELRQKVKCSGEVTFVYNIISNIQGCQRKCPTTEFLGRQALIQRCCDSLQLETPVVVLNTMFHLCKIRMTESIDRCPVLGLVHSPGGDQYYCGVWMNDQAEYALPIFPLFDDDKLFEVSCNTYQNLVKYFPHDPSRPLPHSVEISGAYIGPLCRGDAGMFAWGLSLFLLYRGDREEINQWMESLQEACARITYTIRGPANVVETDTDELEGRYPTGRANFSSNCLAILGLETAALLDRCINQENTKYSASLMEKAEKLRVAVEKYFRNPKYGRDDEEPPYIYFEESNDTRSWICLASLASLKYAKQTMSFLLSPESKMWTAKTGLRVAASNPDDVWDRQTLYALRCGFLSREKNTLARLIEYAESRLLGPHVCYPVEEQKYGHHLAAESALYCRIFIDGLLGLRPATQPPYTLQAYEIWPVMPGGWTTWNFTEFTVGKMRLGIHVTLVESDIEVVVHWSGDVSKKARGKVDDGFRIEQNSLSVIELSSTGR